MKTAQIFSISSAEAHGFRWAWRSSDASEQSRVDFIYFYECVEDARAAGYSVELSGTSAKTVDGRGRHGLV